MSIAQKLTAVAENQRKVFDSGYANGLNEGYSVGEQDGRETGRAEGEADGYQNGYNDGFAEGEQACYDKAWATAVLNPLSAYDYMGSYWNDDNFRPTGDLVAGNKATTFLFRETNIKNIKACLERQGVRLDLSKATSVDSVLLRSATTHLPVLDVSGITKHPISFCEALSNLEYVEKIILPNSYSDAPKETWLLWKCYKLQHVRIEGLIDFPLNLQHSTLLSKESIVSIFNCLSTTTSGTVLTLSQTAVTNAFGSTTADEWTALIATKTNWTINLS